MHIDPQVIVFVFSVAMAFMFAVIYDLYEKLRECERTIDELKTTVGDGKLVASILNERWQSKSKTNETPQPESSSTPLWSPFV